MAKTLQPADARHILACVIEFVLADRAADAADIDIEQGTLGLADFNAAMERRDDALTALRELAEALLPELQDGGNDAAR